MKVTHVKKVTDYKYLNLFEISFRDKTDAERVWQLASRNKEPKCVSGKFDFPDAVVIVPYHLQEQKLVVIEEFRVPLGGYQYGFPAGLVDEGESLEETVRRELKEETGLRLTKILKSSPPVYSTSGMTDESVSIVYVECDGEISNRDNTASEDITALFVSQEDAARLCNDSMLKFDVKTWLVLSTYAASGELLF